jgi:hypothetical protein
MVHSLIEVVFNIGVEDIFLIAHQNGHDQTHSVACGPETLENLAILIVYLINYSYHSAPNHSVP